MATIPYMFYFFLGGACVAIIAAVVVYMSSKATQAKAKRCPGTRELKQHIKKAVDTLRSNVDTIADFDFLDRKPQELIAHYPFYVDVLQLGSFMYRNKCFTRKHVRDACMDLYGPELDNAPDLHAKGRYLLVDLHDSIDYYFDHAEEGLADIL